MNSDKILLQQWVLNKQQIKWIEETNLKFFEQLKSKEWRKYKMKCNSMLR